VIFYDITGIQGRGILQIISINHKSSDKLFEASENENEIFERLDTVKKIYYQIDAKCVIIHPELELIQSSILKEYTIQFSIEN
jgi:hypothetical protein